MASPAPSAEPTRTLELLAPAGDLECAKAAVACGADAIYFGLDRGFNARARATNISLDVLPELMDFLHRWKVRGYLTLNTLIFADELAELEKVTRHAAAAGVDAVLVQDLGAARLIRAICPTLPLHASTQMTLTSSETIDAIAELGIERVVLARELSIDEIGKIHSQTAMPLEVFAHGALCVAYSGQCMTSESLGGRSANRGQCAQACRLPYELVCDDRDVDLGAMKYLLSPQDLAAYDLVPELLAAGVCSLKIEGRLKTPEYVANITTHYRQAIDAALGGSRAQFSARDREEMELSFSRGFSPGWLGGCDHKQLVPGLSSAKRGVLLGEVSHVGRGRVGLRLRASIACGDGVALDGIRGTAEEQGGRVYQIFAANQSLPHADAGQEVELAFAHGAIDFARLHVGQQIWKNDDPQLNRRLRQSYATLAEGRPLPVSLTIHAAVGQPLEIAARLGDAECALRSDEPLQQARKHPLTEEVLREQFGRLGGTRYELGDVQATIVGAPMAPLSVLGRLRHELVRLLDELPVEQLTRPVAPEPVLPRMLASIQSRPTNNDQPRLHVLCRSLDTLRAAIEHGSRSLLADFADIREYHEVVMLCRAYGAEILLATPRIQKPDEMGIFRAMLKPEADGVLARNLSGMAFFRSHTRVVADFSLNVTNPLTAEYLLNLGAERLTASYDLNREQLLDLVAAIPNAPLEIVLHQHMPLFHMEHCVFCAVLSPGTNKTNCGRPCDTHQVRLRDRAGMEHPLVADVGCRNTLFNATPQSGAEAANALLREGVRHFRVELLATTPTADVARTIELYEQLLRGALSGKQVWTELRAANRVGVTRGTLELRRDPLAIL